MKDYKILTVNPGSTSTKIALYINETVVFKNNVVHSAEELAKFPLVSDQLGLRRDTVIKAAHEAGETLCDCDAFCGRGGGLASCEGGTYEVSELMTRHASSGKYGGNHPAVLGCQLAAEFAAQYSARAFVVNPPDVDEFCDEARFTGLSDCWRTSHIHALNQKETAIRAAADMGMKYADANFIVAHIGGGVSVTAHRKGRMIDSNDIINGEGPMAPTRAGSLQAVGFMELCYSGKWTRDELYKRLTKTGGLVDHLGTSEMREAAERAESGDKYAMLVYKAFIYQLAKWIGAMSAVLCGRVDAIILTGGIANDKKLCAELGERVNYIAPIAVYPGEFELEALAAGALRVLRGEERAKEYTGRPVFSGFDKQTGNDAGYTA